MEKPFLLPRRGVLSLAGEDAVPFLNGLISNDARKAAGDQAVYACLLTPQGKFLHDFLILPWQGGLLLVPERQRLEELHVLLRKYRLRAKVTLTPLPDWQVWGLLSASEAAMEKARSLGGVCIPDPRHPGLGMVGASPAAPLDATENSAVHERRRLALGVPDGSRDLPPGQAILLENNIDALNGIDWDKGCYMGQELTARTRYRGLVRKRLLPVTYDGPPPGFDTPLLAEGQEAGRMRSGVERLGLALLRQDFQMPGTALTGSQGNTVKVAALDA